MASAILAVIARPRRAHRADLVAARHGRSGRSYQASAAGRLTVDLGLINMNADNVGASMAQLRDGTVGELNTGFDSSIAPYRDVVKTPALPDHRPGRSVSIEEVHNDLQPQPGQRPAAPTALPPEFASRTDTVLWWPPRSVRTPAPRQPSAPGAPTGPITVRWNLRLGVSDIDGTPMISRLESLR